MANSSSLLAEQAKQGIQIMLVSLFKAGNYIELLSLHSTCSVLNPYMKCMSVIHSPNICLM